jgi:hypothetical protein
MLQYLPTGAISMTSASKMVISQYTDLSALRKKEAILIADGMIGLFANGLLSGTIEV